MYGLLQAYYNGAWVLADLYRNALRDWTTAAAACRQLGWATGFLSFAQWAPTGGAMYDALARFEFAFNESDSQLCGGCLLKSVVMGVEDVSSKPFTIGALECRRNGELCLVYEADLETVRLCGFAAVHATTYSTPPPRQAAV